MVEGKEQEKRSNMNTSLHKNESFYVKMYSYSTLNDGWGGGGGKV